MYTYNDLLAAYEQAGVVRGGVVYLTSALHEVMDFEKKSAQAIVEAHVKALETLLGPGGTLIVPGWTWHLCNTETAWDPLTTKSRLTGAISEHVRCMEGTRRSFHPFDSSCARGGSAGDFVDGVSRHQCGPGTPERRMVEADALAVSLGLHPRMTCSTVHQVEMEMGVPYRYTKEYIQPVMRNGTVKREPFYRFVWYRDIDLRRDGNRTLFERLSGLMTVNETPLGTGTIWSYEMADFFHYAIQVFKDDIYVWCESPPTSRPYRK